MDAPLTVNMQLKHDAGSIHGQNPPRTNVRLEQG